MSLGRAVTLLYVPLGKNQIQINARFASIPVDNLAEFKRVAAQALEIARGEAGTLRYDWFFSDDETVCVVRETYEDSAAVLAHVPNAGAGQLSTIRT